MATDFTKKPLEILVDLIDLTNSISLTTSDLIVGPVAALPAGGNKNTAVTIYAAPGSRYTGLRDLTYDRVNLSAIPRGRSTEFENTDAIFISQLIPTINEAFSINLQPEDYINEPLPSFSGTTYYPERKFYLKAAPQSYVWHGSVELTLKGNKQDVRSLLGVTLLSGFSLPQTDLETDISIDILDGYYFRTGTTSAIQNTTLNGFNYPVYNTPTSSIPNFVLNGFQYPTYNTDYGIQSTTLQGFNYSQQTTVTLNN